MDVCEQIRYILKSKELTQRWLAKEMDVDEKTLSGKLSRGSISADELIQISKILDIDLNKMKEGTNIMFEWLKGKGFNTEIGGRHYEAMEVIEVNKESKLVTEGYFDQDIDDDRQTVVVDIFDSNIHMDFNEFDNWEDKLYNKLLSENMLIFYSLATESGDNWLFFIHRIETKLDTVDELIIVNYVMSFCSEVKGEILTLNKKDETKEKFVEWITELSEGEALFNNSDGTFIPLNAITYEISQISKEEHNLLNKLHG